MTLTHAFVDVRRHLEVWCGYPSLAEAMQTFDDLRVYVAGGVVRNVLMGVPAAPKDFDFFLQGTSVASAIDYLGCTGRLDATPYGSPRWYPTDREVRYADLIPVADFAPGLWPCEDIVDVLDQFDFTANAVAFDLRTGEAFDPQNGARDAARRVMKMVRFDYPHGPYVPTATLDRNVVLWFRIVHYASTLDLTFDPLTRDWLRAHRNYEAQLDDFARLFFRPDLRALETVHG
ncbi:hypothetical protein [Paraburkholderia sp. 35.1]|uniref:hypothetical protein n=1 Tax=Paraburkholderia sp. 35.1 TaxID=2991058 RepID=UPI003D19541D